MLALNRLDRRDRTVLVEQIAGGKALPDEVVVEIADRTDGVPLFVEELTKSVIESGLLREESDRYVLDRALPPFAIPATLHDSLMARLDRLAQVRLVVQTGAAIGREFTYALLRTVSRLPEDELQAALGRLVAAELVFQRGTPPAAVYSFKHALVQDAAHGSLLRNARRQLHAQIAEALETQSSEIIDSEPELLAQHYAEAGLVEKSVAYWEKAGRRSAARSAMAEAAAQLQKGLDQLALLPDSPERRRQELEFCSALGAALLFAKGLSAPETGHAYARARELWEQLGSPSEFLGIPYGQSFYHAFRGELDRAQSIAEDMLRLGHRRNDAAGVVLGHLSCARGLLYRGKFGQSKSHLEAGLALYDPTAHRSLVDRAGSHPQVYFEGYLAIVLFCQGYPDQAFARSSAYIAEARRLAHPPSLAPGLAVGAWLLSIGWIKVRSGDVTEGMSLLRSGLAAYRATGAELFAPVHMSHLARACEVAGRIGEGLALLEDALQIVERTGERWFAAELNRHKGRLLLRQGHAEAAEELYRKASSIAEAQEAKLWELHAAVSLARLRRDQGRGAEARDLLAPVYGWFTEGFATPDLEEAKALLDDLA
jgi:predicted ATPase